MDKRQTLTALFEGSPKEAEQALQNLRTYHEELKRLEKQFEENLTVLEQSRYNEITEKIIIKDSEEIFDNLTDSELEELIDLTEKLEGDG